MKRMKYTYLGILIWIAAGCVDSEVDLSPPSMEILSFAPAPIEDEICGTSEPVVFRLTGGDDLSFEALFVDDVALSQYKVDIHNNFDCHGHGGGSAPSIATPSVDNQTEDWSILTINDLTGVSTMVEESFTVPTNVTAGNYHYQIQVIDEAGNDNPAANFYALKIENPLDNVPPQIIVEAPGSNTLAVSKGQTIRFKGRVTDDRSLSDGGNGILFLSYTDLSSGNTFSTDQAFAFDAEVDTVFDFDFEYKVPQTLVSGNYRLILGAHDGVRNTAPFSFFDIAVQ